MNKHSLAVAAACLLAGASLAAFAAPHGGGGGAPGGGVSAGTPGGMSAGHMSATGLANTNGPQAADREKGLDRAEDRMSAEGASHEKARAAQAKSKRHRPPAETAAQPR